MYTSVQIYRYIINPLFINRFKIALKVLCKQKPNHFIVQRLSQHPCKTWKQKCSNVELNSQNKCFQRHSCLSCTFQIQFYFTGKRQRKSSKISMKHVTLLFEVKVHEQIGTQATLPHEQVRMIVLKAHWHMGM